MMVLLRGERQARMVHFPLETLADCSRRREEAERGQGALGPLPNIGCYREGEVSRPTMQRVAKRWRRVRGSGLYDPVGRVPSRGGTWNAAMLGRNIVANQPSSFPFQPFNPLTLQQIQPHRP